MTTKLSGRLFNDNTVSPLDFGAVGDGTADDTAAMNRAIAHLATGSKILDLNHKTYKVTTQLDALGTGGVTIRNGDITYDPDSTNRGKPMLKITVAQADATERGMSHSPRPGDKSIQGAEHTLNVADKTYIWIESKTWDYVYKGPNARGEDQFPRSDRAFKGEIVKVDWSDKTGADDIYYLENEVNLGYVYGGSGSDAKFIALTMLDDIVFENVNIKGPGIVRKNLGGDGGIAPITVEAGVRKITWSDMAHGLTTRDYLTVDTGDYGTSGTTQGLLQGPWKVTTASDSDVNILLNGLADRTAEDGSTVDSHSLDLITEGGQSAFDTWVYLRSEIGISVEYCSNFKMKNCSVTGFGEAGVVTMKCYEPEFDNCHLESARPESSGGLVIGNGNYRPYIHDCKFTGYVGITLGTTRMKVLMEMTRDGYLGLSYMGSVQKALIKNNQFKVKETGISVRENAFHTEISDNSIDIESTFLQERDGVSNYNRLPSKGIDSQGCFVSVLRNTIRGVMHYGVYHRQNHKVFRTAGETLAGAVVDIGDGSDQHFLFSHFSGTDDEAGSLKNNRAIGNELEKFFINIQGNEITALRNIPSADVLTNLVKTSRYGIFIENQTMGKVTCNSAWSTKVIIKGNEIRGQLANIRLRLVNGRFKGVHIVENVLDSTAYLDRDAGGDGQGTKKLGRGLGGFYDDRTWEVEGSGFSKPTAEDGLQKASGICLMVENYDEYPLGSLIQARIEDVDISNNIIYRSQKLQDRVPDSGSADSGGDFAIGGTSSISCWFDCPTGGGQVRHISVTNNRCHYGGYYCWSQQSRRSPWTSGSGYAPKDNCSVRYSVVHLNVGNISHTQGDDPTADEAYGGNTMDPGYNGFQWIYTHTAAGDTWAKQKNTKHGGGASGGNIGSSFGAIHSNGSATQYMGRIFNYLRWA